MLEVMQVGSLANKIVSTRENPQRERVYLTNGLSPAINCCGGGGLQPYIVEETQCRNNGFEK